MKIKSGVLVFLLLLVQNLVAQKGDATVFGKITDSEGGQSLEYVPVKVLKIKDSSIVSGAFTDADGKFTIENLEYGKYILKITFPNYKPQFLPDVIVSAAAKNFNTGTIKLQSINSKELKEVTVKGQLDVLTTGIDKKVYNVGEDLSVKGGTANDILNRLPSVEVDQDGNVMLRGEGTVTVLIDGRPSSISGGNGRSLLDALPAGSIERIEIVTNPSAKYDPDGTSGIINIVLKKNKLKGFNGSISTNLGSGNLKNGNVAETNASLSYRNGWINVYGTYSYRYLDGYRNNVSYIKQSFTADSGRIVDQNRLGTDLNAGHTFRTGADFYLKGRNSLGVSATGSTGRRDRTGDLWNDIYDFQNVKSAYWERVSYDPSQQHNYDFNLNFKHDFKNDRGNFVVDLNQSLGNENIQGYYTSNFFNPDSITQKLSTVQQRLFDREKNNITSGQFDLTYLMPKINARLETGAKGIVRFQTVDTYSQRYDYTNSAWQSDTISNFNYKYNEQIYSLYSIFGQQLGKFKYQGGIRLEQAYQIPDLVSQNIQIVNNYFNWFPSAHVRYAILPKTEVSLSYSKRITRAQAADLNPFTSYADPFNLRVGNPYLKPEYIDSYDFGFSHEAKKWNVLVSAYYRHNTGVITRFKEYYDNGTSAVTFKNISETHTLGQEVVLSFKPFPWWKNMLSWNGNYVWYITHIPNLPDRQGYIMNLKYNTSVEFWKKTATATVSVTLNGKRVTAQGIAQRQGPVDIAFEKKFKEGKWAVGCRVSDVFNMMGFYLQVDRPGVYQTSEFKWMTRRFFLTASYKFGKLEISNKKSINSDGGGGDM